MSTFTPAIDDSAIETLRDDASLDKTNPHIINNLLYVIQLNIP